VWLDSPPNFGTQASMICRRAHRWRINERIARSSKERVVHHDRVLPFRAGRQKVHRRRFLANPIALTLTILAMRE
jgi:hypothetical protein